MDITCNRCGELLTYMVLDLGPKEENIEKEVCKNCLSRFDNMFEEKIGKLKIAGVP